MVSSLPKWPFPALPLAFRKITSWGLSRAVRAPSRAALARRFEHVVADPVQLLQVLLVGAVRDERGVHHAHPWRPFALHGGHPDLDLFQLRQAFVFVLELDPPRGAIADLEAGWVVSS